MVPSGATGAIPPKRHLSPFLGIFRFHIANDGLPTVVHVHMLDADKLVTVVTQASKDLNLGCIGPEADR
jgi:hypothetical protein